MLASRRTSTTFIIFSQDKRKLHTLDSPSPLLSLPPPKECAYVRAYGHVTTKFSRMDRLPNCLSYGAALACASCVHKFTCEITMLPWQRSVDTLVNTCLVPRPHYYARPMRFGSRGPRKFLRPRARSIQPKFRPVRPEKRTTSKGGQVFTKLFRLDRTDPLSFGPKFPEILVEWIAPLDKLGEVRHFVSLGAELFEAGELSITFPR